MSSNLFSTLYSLLKPDFSPIFDELVKGHVHCLTQRLVKPLSRFDWQLIDVGIQQQLPHLLDVRLLDVLISAWSKHQAVQAVVKKQQAQLQKGEVAIVPLPVHRICSNHKPILRLLLNQQAVFEMVIDIHLLFKLRGVVLKVHQGKICAVMMGELIGIGRMYYQNKLFQESRIDCLSLLAVDMAAKKTALDVPQSTFASKNIPSRQADEDWDRLGHNKLLYLLLGVMISLGLLMLLT